MYVLFRLLDNCAFLTVIVLSVMTGKFMAPTRSQLALFSVLGLEIFYDVMLTVNKYWGLQRLSLQIGIVLFALYYFILSFMRVHLDHQNFLLCLYVVTFRFCAFIIEELVDIGLDMCIHNVLVILHELSHDPRARSRGDSLHDASLKDVEANTLSLSNDRISTSLRQSDDEENVSILCSLFRFLKGCPHNIRTPLMSRDSTQSIIVEKTKKEILKDLMKKNCYLPPNLNYRGSIFAWGTATIKKWDRENYLTEKEFDINLIYLIFLPAFIPTVIICIPISIIVFVAGIIGFLFYNIVTSICRWFGTDSSWNLNSYFEELIDL